MSPPTEGGASSSPQVYKCRWLASCTLEVVSRGQTFSGIAQAQYRKGSGLSCETTLEVEEDMMKIMSMELPLVLLSLVLLSLDTCVLGQGTGTCEPCDCDDRANVCGHIRFTDPSRNSSAGQIQVCFSDSWQTVCGAKDPQLQINLFSDADAKVACFQLGFIDGNASENLGLACKLGHSHLVVKTPCKGWEENLTECNLQPENSGTCSYRTAVSVTCEREPLVKYVCTYVGSIASRLGRCIASWGRARAS